jgi:hypothetical protein
LKKDACAFKGGLAGGMAEWLKALQRAKGAHLYFKTVASAFN